MRNRVKIPAPNASLLLSTPFGKKRSKCVMQYKSIFGSWSSELFPIIIDLPIFNQFTSMIIITGYVSAMKAIKLSHSALILS